MIKQNKELSMIETLEYLKNDTEKESDLIGFIKKFVKLDSKKAKEMKEEIKKMGITKINPKDEVKLMDLLPENQEEISKIFTEIGLDEDESQKILATIKKFK